jgi:hypothetical protein
VARRSHRGGSVFLLYNLILTTFLLELTVTVIALTPAVFFRQFFYVLDFCIIVTSLVLELAFYILEDTVAQAVAGLLVISRLWRFIRIGHGIVSVSHEVAQERYAMLLSYTEEVEGMDCVLSRVGRASSVCYLACT